MGGIERHGEIEGILENLGIPKCWSHPKKSCTVQGMERLKDKDSCLLSIGDKTHFIPFVLDHRMIPVLRHWQILNCANLWPDIKKNVDLLVYSVFKLFTYWYAFS